MKAILKNGEINTELMCEIARSYSRKVNLGNYETIDIFCSRKEEVPMSEAEETSKRLFEFCRAEVEKNIGDYLESKMEVPMSPYEKTVRQNQAYQDNGEARRQGDN
jgi:hypothetical protein